MWYYELNTEASGRTALDIMEFYQRETKTLQNNNKRTPAILLNTPDIVLRCLKGYTLGVWLSSSYSKGCLSSNKPGSQATTVSR